MAHQYATWPLQHSQCEIFGQSSWNPVVIRDQKRRNPMVILSSPCVWLLVACQQLLVVVVVVLDHHFSFAQRESIFEEAGVRPVMLPLKLHDLKKATRRVVLSFDIEPRL